MIIEKKVWPQYFEKLLTGEKSWELRLNDFEINEGDKLVLREWNPEAKEYTGRQLEKEVTYVAKFDLKDTIWPVEEIMEKGIQIISLK